MLFSKQLSPPRRLLLVNTSERKKREAGALERENGSTGPLMAAG